MPSLFAFGDKVVGQPQYTLFAAFGSFALIGFIEFGGPFANRLRSQLVLAATAACMIVAGTLASQSPWLSAAVMTIGSFVAVERRADPVGANGRSVEREDHMRIGTEILDHAGRYLQRRRTTDEGCIREVFWADPNDDVAADAAPGAVDVAG